MAKIAYGTVNKIRKEICTDQDANHNARQLAELFDYLGRPGLPERDASNPPGEANPEYTDYVPGRDDQIDVEPARAYVRFKLQNIFGAGTRGIPVSSAALIYDELGAAYAPSQTFDVYDVLNRYGTAAGTEDGYGIMWDDGTGNQYIEAISLGGLTSAGGIDNYTVNVQAGDTPGFLDAKFDTSVPYDVTRDQFVYFDVQGAGPYTLRAYTNNPAVADEKVAVAVTDTPGYLTDKVFGTIGAPAYSSGTHQLVYYDVVGSGPYEMRLFTNQAVVSLTHKVKVASIGDTEEYLWDSLDSASQKTPGTYAAAPSSFAQVYGEVTGAGAAESLLLYADASSVSIGTVVSRFTLNDTLDPATNSQQITLVDKGSEVVTGNNSSNHFYGLSGWTGVAVLVGDLSTSTTWEIIDLEKYHSHLRLKVNVSGTTVTPNDPLALTWFGEGTQEPTSFTLEYGINIANGETATYVLSSISSGKPSYRPVAVDREQKVGTVTEASGIPIGSISSPGSGDVAWKVPLTSTTVLTEKWYNIMGGEPIPVGATVQAKSVRGYMIIDVVECDPAV